MKRRILKDRTFPASEQINKHQDFELINRNYSLIKKMIMKKIIVWSAAMAGVAGITALVLLNGNTEDKLVNKHDAATVVKYEPLVKPPSVGSEVPFTTYRISLKNGGVIHHPTGSTITIPPEAFFNAGGKSLGDSIDIKYREFHNLLDIFLSGIPMEYDSAGLVRTFESAGMLEILAFDNATTLNLREGKPIDISMASDNSEERFNLYALDTVLRNWVYLGKDRVEKSLAAQPTKTVKHNKKQKTEKQEIKNPESIQPVLSNPKNYSFRIAYDKTDFPELAAYENVLFEVADAGFKPAYYKINWNKISLDAGSTPGLYTIRLKKADTTISVMAKPVFDKENYSEALEKFEASHRESALGRQEEEFGRQYKLNQVNKELAGYDSRNIVTTASEMTGLATRRLFTIQRMGTFNCDYPLPPIVQYAYTLQTFKNSEAAAEVAKELAYNTIYLAEKGKNAVFCFRKGEAVRCNPKAKNLMWTITENNQIAFFRITDYTRLVNGGENKINPVLAKSQELAFEEIRQFSENGLN